MTEETQEIEAKIEEPRRLALIVRGFVAAIVFDRKGYDAPEISFVESETAQVGQRWTGKAFVDPVIRRHAQIRDGVVVNVSNAPEGWDDGEAELIASDTAQIGQLYADGKFSDPAPAPVPLLPIEAWRFEAAIEIAGIKDDIDAAIELLPNPRKTVLKAKRARISSYHRDDADLADLSMALELSSDAVDDLWRLAASL